MNENGTAGAVRNERKLDLTVVGGAPMAGGLVPRNLEEALQLVKLLAESELLPDHLRKKPSDVYYVIAKGMELGLKPMQSLSELFVVKGKVGCSAALKRALVLTSPVCEYFQLIESSPTKCVYEAKRKGAKDPVRLTKTWEDAVRAKLSTKDTYQQHPDAMLRAWCSRTLADAEFPDVTQGLRNDDDREIEVLGDVVQVTPNRPLQSVAAPVSPIRPVADVPEDETELRSPDDEQPAETPPGEPPIEEQLRIKVEEAVDRKQLNALVDQVNAVKDLTARDSLKKLWTRRYNDMGKGAKS